MIRSTALATAVGMVVAVGYVLCRLIVGVAPEFLFNVGQNWVHTLNLEPLRAARPMSLPTFVLGFVTSVVVSWVAAWLTGQLYERWA